MGLPRFTRAIVRPPGKNLIHGLSTAGLGPPDFGLARSQHAAYVEALRACGLAVLVLEPDEEFPDSTFVEDVALLTQTVAIVTNPGAPSRRGETAAIKGILGEFFPHIEDIRDPGTVEAGDILMVGTHCYIGMSARTNENGARQVIRHLERYGLTGSVVPVEKVLHLKTGVAYLEHGNLVVGGEFRSRTEFQGFHHLGIDDDEAGAANCLWVNDVVLLPEGFPKARRTIEGAGYATRALDVSEFQKLDGGLSCLSLRF